MLQKGSGPPSQTLECGCKLTRIEGKLDLKPCDKHRVDYYETYGYSFRDEGQHDKTTEKQAK